jgi:Zn finger protein HypA/HybF involved in hydrogenase expression
MAMMTNCTCRGCHKLNEPVLDKVSRAVFCSECGGEQTGITDFAKRSMESMGQIKRHSLKKEAFSIECSGCKRIAVPLLLGNGKLQCPLCKAQHMTLSPIIERSIVQHITKKV